MLLRPEQLQSFLASMQYQSILRDVIIMDCEDLHDATYRKLKAGL